MVFTFFRSILLVTLTVALSYNSALAVGDLNLPAQQKTQPTTIQSRIALVSKINDQGVAKTCYIDLYKNDILAPEFVDVGTSSYGEEFIELQKQNISPCAEKVLEEVALATPSFQVNKNKVAGAFLIPLFSCALAFFPSVVFGGDAALSDTSFSAESYGLVVGLGVTLSSAVRGMATLVMEAPVAGKVLLGITKATGIGAVCSTAGLAVGYIITSKN